MSNKNGLVRVIKNFWTLLNKCEGLPEGCKPILQGHIDGMLLIIASLLKEGKAEDVAQAICEALNIPGSGSNDSQKL